MDVDVGHFRMLKTFDLWSFEVEKKNIRCDYIILFYNKKEIVRSSQFNLLIYYCRGRFAIHVNEVFDVIYQLEVDVINETEISNCILKLGGKRKGSGWQSVLSIILIIIMARCLAKSSSLLDCQYIIK